MLPSPPITVASTASAVCSGNSVALTANGAATYTWNGSVIASGFTTTLAAGAIFTVVGTDSNSCVGSSTIAVGVYPNPWIYAMYPVNAICSGDSVTLTGNGAISYTWSNGMTANPIQVAPNNTTVYTVWGTDQNSCKGSASAQIVVNPTPDVMITSGQTTICAGETATLSCSGANICIWNSVYLGSSIQVSPLVTTTYVVVGTTTGCSDTAMAVVIVDLCNVGIDSNKNATDYMYVFPNPTTGTLIVKFLTTESKRVLRVYNTMGQLILEEQPVSENSLINLENYASGIYYLQVNAERSFNYKIIKQ